jgi:hypothetical protein
MRRAGPRTAYEGNCGPSCATGSSGLHARNSSRPVARRFGTRSTEPAGRSGGLASSAFPAVTSDAACAVCGPRNGSRPSCSASSRAVTTGPGEASSRQPASAPCLAAHTGSAVRTAGHVGSVSPTESHEDRRVDSGLTSASGRSSKRFAGTEGPGPRQRSSRMQDSAGSTVPRVSMAASGDGPASSDLFAAAAQENTPPAPSTSCSRRGPTCRLGICSFEAETLALNHGSWRWMASIQAGGRPKQEAAAARPLATRSSPPAPALSSGSFKGGRRAVDKVLCSPER